MVKHVDSEITSANIDQTNSSDQLNADKMFE